jgi:general secretion pathway protein A
MYLDFYQLKRAPFPLTPDPAFFFGSASHHAALDALAAGIATRQGLVTITGARGVGKTTLVHAYLARVVSPPLTTIVSWHAHLSFVEILAMLARRFAVPEATNDAASLLAQLQQRLRDEAHQGRTVVLIIDEAQHLPRETLEQLLLLTYRPPAKEPLLVLVLVGQPALQRHLRRSPLRRVALRLGIHATISPMTKAESLAYIRQRLAKVALPGGPLFTEEALQAIGRHAHGVPHAVNLLCTAVLQAGFWAHQQPITADLVHQVRAASLGARPFGLGWWGLAAAGLVLTAGLLWRAPFSAGLQASRSGPAARAHSWMEARRPTSAPQPEAPRLPQPEPAPQARAALTSGRAVGPDPGEGYVRLGPRESLERQDLKTPPATLPPGDPALPSVAPVGMALKSCDELKAEIQAKLEAKRLTGYALTILTSGDVHGHQIVGSCEGSTKKIALTRSQTAP